VRDPVRVQLRSSVSSGMNSSVDLHRLVEPQFVACSPARNSKLIRTNPPLLPFHPSAKVIAEPELKIHLVDGTYELFRHYFAVPKARDAQGREVGAVRGVLASLLAMMHSGVTHMGVATDHVIESFRNDLWQGYKTGEGVEPDLLSQFPILEEVLTAAGIVAWPMVEFEADDALAAATALALKDPRVEQVVICTPDKDLAQCVQGSLVVQLIRRTGVTIDEAGVIAKFGVPPASIPDYLALVGDSADGYPGLRGWGAKSTAAVLAKFGHIESIPESALEWHVNVLNSGSLASTLAQERELALLFRKLATLRTDIPLFDNVDFLRWNGPRADFDAIGQLLDKAVTEKKPKTGPARVGTSARAKNSEKTQ
jgi:5'-3' exonuclease